MNLRALLFLLVMVHTAIAQSTLYTVENNGARSKHINIVFLSEAYSAADLPAFAGHVTAAVNYLFSREPWMQYRSYCNVFPRKEVVHCGGDMSREGRQIGG